MGALLHRVKQAVGMASLLYFAVACGGGSAGARSEPTCPLPEPAQDAREALLQRFGERALEALREDEPQRLLYDDLALRVLLSSAEATRLTALRAVLDERLGPIEGGGRLERARLAAVCVQGAREEEAGGPLGLAGDAWVFDRVLVVAEQARGRRLAAWIEGRFVLSDAGLGAVDLERFESPRWEHTDIDIAPCDVAWSSRATP